MGELHFHLGALNEDDRYVFPDACIWGMSTYRCPECYFAVVCCNGPEKQIYFRHSRMPEKWNLSILPCQHYEIANLETCKKDLGRLLATEFPTKCPRMLFVEKKCVCCFSKIDMVFEIESGLVDMHESLTDADLLLTCKIQTPFAKVPYICIYYTDHANVNENPFFHAQPLRNRIFPSHEKPDIPILIIHPYEALRCYPFTKDRPLLCYSKTSLCDICAIQLQDAHPS